MMIKRVLFILGISIWVHQMVKAQDPHFSQFFASPLTQNPANIGTFTGQFRVASNYRDQWPGINKAYTTTTVSVDAHMLSQFISSNDQLSWGLLAMSDASGNGLLGQQSATVGLSYSKGLNQDRTHAITIGFQSTYLKLRFNPEKADFEDELSPAGFDLPTAESFFLNNNQQSVFDLHAGVKYVGNLSEATLFYLGFAGYHLGRPAMGFFDNRNSIDMRFNISSGGYTIIDPNNFIHFSAQYQRQNNFRDFTYGAAWNRILNNSSNGKLQGYLGVWSRNNEFLIPYMGLDFNGFQFGFSQDLGVGTKKAKASQYQSSEISFVWTMVRDESLKSLECPKF